MNINYPHQIFSKNLCIVTKTAFSYLASLLLRDIRIFVCIKADSEPTELNTGECSDDVKGSFIVILTKFQPFLGNEHSWK